MIYNTLLENSKKKKKQVVPLLDPDHYTKNEFEEILINIGQYSVPFILLGGSLVSEYIHEMVAVIKQKTMVPVVLFPGSLLQVANNADAIFLLSLLSGRNPDLLIGNHVLAAPLLKRSNMEIIPTGYILIGDHDNSSVKYISNTQPIPSGKNDIATATAIAGEMIGNKLIYLEGGSGASVPIKSELISEVKSNISVPLIVGGGVKSREEITGAFKAGADVVVIGTAFEKNAKKLKELLPLK